MSQIFITGGFGFVGRHLVPALLTDHDVVLFEHRPHLEFKCQSEKHSLRFVRGSLLDLVPENLDGCEVVIHLAAQAVVGVAQVSPLPSFETNIMGTIKLLEMARQAGVNLCIVASSDKAYGDAPAPYREDSPLNGIFPYEASKACVDILSRCYARSFGLNVVVARCTNIYGPGDLHWTRIVPATIRATLEQKTLTLSNGGKSVRDFTYIDDTISAYLSLLEKGPGLSGEAFNFGSGHGFSMKEMADTIMAIMGTTTQVILGPAIKEVDQQWTDSSKAREVLSWEPQVSLGAGLRKTVDWYRGYFERGND